MRSPQAALRFSVLCFAAAVAVHAATFAGQVPGWAGVALFLAVFPVLYFSVRAFPRRQNSVGPRNS